MELEETQKDRDGIPRTGRYRMALEGDHVHISLDLQPVYNSNKQLFSKMRFHNKQKKHDTNCHKPVANGVGMHSMPMQRTRSPANLTDSNSSLFTRSSNSITPRFEDEDFSEFHDLFTRPPPKAPLIVVSRPPLTPEEIIQEFRVLRDRMTELEEQLVRALKANGHS
ncbi:hypothetical protein BDP27DRAFT_1451611 [Rhodocollybia butyracea]|uniref:Uncharacterized protein n=1 Tax=Rhodocollybia butyracea TaxID=206335 RepID=A0A9P5PG04_9AGAR|nr:hypothetical protein BDP27DRAFT_1451611 [Rhodocollybia butyracea]